MWAVDWFSVWYVAIKANISQSCKHLFGRCVKMNDLKLCLLNWVHLCSCIRPEKSLLADDQHSREKPSCVGDWNAHACTKMGAPACWRDVTWWCPNSVCCMWETCWFCSIISCTASLRIWSEYIHMLRTIFCSSTNTLSMCFGFFLTVCALW